MYRTSRYRLYPSKAQARVLADTLDTCRDLYNSLLHWRIHDCDRLGRAPTRFQQQAARPGWKKTHPELKRVHSQALQDVVHRADRAFQDFFRRIKAGEPAGHPKRRDKGYDSLTYTQSGFHLEDDRLCLSKIGAIKARLYRPLVGAVRTCTVRRVCGQWFVCIACQAEPVPLPPSEEEVGLDVGLTHFAALSTGEFIENPRLFRRAERSLAQTQRRVSRARRGTRRQRTAKRAASRLNARVRDRRHDFAHQTARRLVTCYGLIAVESLVIRNMVRNHCLAKSISDAAWSLFRLVLTWKAEKVGRSMVHVNPANTSRRCSGCGLVAPKTLSDRRHQCACGLTLNRDTNAALNILQDARRIVFSPLAPTALKGATAHAPSSPSFALLPGLLLCCAPVRGCPA